jgi:hypothetical protein
VDGRRGVALGTVAIAACLLSALAPSPRAAAAAGRAASGTPVVPQGIPGDPLSYLRPEMRTRMSEVRGQVAAVRGALATRRLSDAMLATAAAGGHPFGAVPSLPSPSAADEQRVASLPSELRAPVSGLLAAVEAARTILGTLPAGEVGREVGELLDGLSTVAARTAAAPGAVTMRNPVSGTTRTQSPPVPLLGPVRLGDATRRAVSRGPEAALLVAEAIDAYLPALQRAAAAMPHGGAAVATGCDLLDQTPLLCVGGSGDNAYTQPETLLVDMGGNNSFSGFEGAAPFPDPASPTAYVPLSVAVVAGSGNNSYTAPRLPLATGSAPAVYYGAVSLGEGAGVVGGVGMLVDASSGRHTYTAVAPPPPGVRDNGYPIPEATVAQGSGALGQGVLADAGSAATFSATGPTSPAITSGVFAQGDGQYDPNGGCQNLQGYCSYGLLMSTGGGADTYAIDGGEIAAPGGTSLVGAAGQGAGEGLLGAGFLLDDGGADSFSVTARAGSDVHLWPNQLLQNPATSVDAQGYGDTGAGMLVEGGGSHSYRVAVEQHGTNISTWGVRAQGAADFAGLGVLSDAGSGNTFDLEQSSTEAHTFAAPAAVDAYVARGLDTTVHIVGQGSTWAGTALLDSAGAATYTAVAREDINDRLAGTPASTLDITGFTPPTVLVQGAAEPNIESTTYALLLNRSGHADYRAEATDTIEAAATSGARAEVPLQFDYSAMQGASAWNSLGETGMAQAALLDMGGPGDTFQATQRHAVTTSPDSGGGLAAGGFWDPMQGNGDGALLLTLSAAPQILSSPANGVCPASPGASGSTQWTTCGMDGPAGEDPDHTTYDYLSGFNHGDGAGLAPSSTATSPSLTIDSAPAAANDGTPATVAVTLLDAAGAPLAGATVHLDAQLGLATDAAGLTVQWLDVSQATGVTDVAGRARISLPLGYGRLLNITSLAPTWSTRLLATFDGAPGLTPRHAARAFALDFGPPASVPELPLLPLAPLTAGLALLTHRRTRRRRSRAAA